MSTNTRRTGTRRKSGGQPGNTNALKSGFFSRRFTPLDISDLETLLHADGLQSEINLLRVTMRQLQDIAAGEDNKQDLIQTLMTYSSVATRLAGLLRTNQALSKRQTDVAGMLYQVIEEVFGNALDPRNP